MKGSPSYFDLPEITANLARFLQRAVDADVADVSTLQTWRMTQTVTFTPYL